MNRFNCKITALDEAGYQFIQTRGLIVIQSKIGKVAVLPLGMAQVSSIVGTAVDIADQLQQLLQEGGGDGFICISHTLPGCMDEFSDLVIPELRRRGLRTPGYEHRTLRERVRAGARAAA